MAKSRRNRKNRSHRKNSRRNRKMYYGGACALASAAPVNEQYGAAMMAQSLAQGNQFATLTRPYHGGGQSVPLAPSMIRGGRRSSCGMMRGGRRSSCGMMRGGAEATNPMAAIQEAVKNVAALAGTAAPAAAPVTDAPKPAAPATESASGSGSAALKGGRRRKSRKGSRKGRKGSRKSRRMYYGGMAPMSIFGSEGVDVDRASAMLGGQDAALNEALAYSKANPQLGGRRRRRSHRRRGMRGGALLEGAPYTQTSSNMLLADSPEASAMAAKMESPAWTGVQQGTFLG